MQGAASPCARVAPARQSIPRRHSPLQTKRLSPKPLRRTHPSITCSTSPKRRTAAKHPSPECDDCDRPAAVLIETPTAGRQWWAASRGASGEGGGGRRGRPCSRAGHATRRVIGRTAAAEIAEEATGWGNGRVQGLGCRRPMTPIAGVQTETDSAIEKRTMSTFLHISERNWRTTLTAAPIGATFGSECHVVRRCHDYRDIHYRQPTLLDVVSLEPALTVCSRVCDQMEYR